MLHADFSPPEPPWELIPNAEAVDLQQKRKLHRRREVPAAGGPLLFSRGMLRSHAEGRF